MTRKVFSSFVLLVAAALIAACGAAPVSGASGTPIVSHGSRVTGYASLLDGLRKVGATVEPAGAVEQPFFSLRGRVIRVDGQEVQVFEFASADEAEAQAALVSPDGSAIGTSLVTWLGTPNFFKAGQVIALYVGDDALTLDHLMQVLGLQFAGGPFIPVDAPTDGEVVGGGGMPLPAADAAVKALAALRGIPAEDIAVVSAEPVVWPNSCLGLERPEQICALVIIPGYRVILQVGAEQFVYHTDETGATLILVP